MCGTDQKAASGVLTTDVFIVGEGDLEVCVECIKEAADLIGWMDRSKHQEVVTALQGELAEVHEWANAAYAELQAKDSTIESLSTALAKTAAQRDGYMAELQAT